MLLTKKGKLKVSELYRAGVRHDTLTRADIHNVIKVCLDDLPTTGLISFPVHIVAKLLDNKNLTGCMGTRDVRFPLRKDLRDTFEPLVKEELLSCDVSVKNTEKRSIFKRLFSGVALSPITCDDLLIAASK